MADQNNQDDKTVKVNKDMCIGCGMCVSVCPNVFEIQDDGKAEVIEGKEKNCSEAEEATQMCPVGAISCE